MYYPKVANAICYNRLNTSMLCRPAGVHLVILLFWQMQQLIWPIIGGLSPLMGPNSWWGPQLTGVSASWHISDGKLLHVQARGAEPSALLNIVFVIFIGIAPVYFSLKRNRNHAAFVMFFSTLKFGPCRRSTTTDARTCAHLFVWHGSIDFKVRSSSIRIFLCSGL